MEIVFCQGPNNEPMVSSREVAAKFAKGHREVLRAARDVMSSFDAEFSRCNFAQREYVDERGKSQPEILLTKDGFLLLAMGFTGPEAMQWKTRFIQAFNQLMGSVAELKAELARKEQVILQLKGKRKPKCSNKFTLVAEEQPAFEGFEPIVLYRRIPKSETDLSKQKEANFAHSLKTMRGIAQSVLPLDNPEKLEVVFGFIRDLLFRK